MKYLRGFNESFGDEGELYENITYKEFMQYLGGDGFGRLLPFTINDIEIIKKYKGGFSFELVNHRKSIICHWDDNTTSLDSIIMCGNKDMCNFKYPLHSIYSVRIEVLKNDDDYYLIVFGPLYYVCDTIDGVISLFKEIIK
jgi:hypothetical protein